MAREELLRGVGAGWRPGLALAIERRARLGFAEVMADDLDPRAIPEPLLLLRERGVALVPHAVSLSLGGAERPSRRRLDRLAALARRLDAPLVSEHVAFVRAGGREAGHLLPVPRTRAALEVLVANVREAQARLPVPLALENIAALVAWPGAELTEAEFLSELLERTGALLLLDLANVYANAWNGGGEAGALESSLALLDALPLERLAYAHVAGGAVRDGVYHDTHGAPVPRGVLTLVEALAARAPHAPAILLERDEHLPREAELHAELDAIEAACARGASARSTEFARA